MFSCIFCCSVSSLRRAGTGIFNSEEAVSKFVLVLASDTEHSASSIKLLSHVLVHLAEFVELSGDVLILQLQHLSMLLIGVLLGEVVDVEAALLRVLRLRVLQILPLQEQRLFAVLQSDLEVAHLSTEVQVSVL